jgi:sulfatase maturation enzyme AslB (radical SAM superfamily)
VTTRWPEFDQLHVTDPGIRTAILSGRLDEAAAHSQLQLAASMSDLATVQLANKQIEDGVKSLQEAITAAPNSRPAYHNLVTALMERGLLQGSNLQNIKSHTVRHFGKVPWMSDYRSILWLPRWLNVEFVLGKCNLKCRMCLGTQSPNYPNRLTYFSAADFDAMLAAAPTVNAVTLSSGDSDPLLHPEIDEIIDILSRRNVLFDIFTNGLPLGARTCRKIVSAQNVLMINFSIDAATAQTYARIRGGDFDRLIRKIEMLQDMKRETGRQTPNLSMSMVAMEDNIAELPDFVRLAIRLGAWRVYVEDLIGWNDGANGNRLATEHPNWRQFIRDAQSVADSHPLTLQLPERLRAGLHEPAPAAVMNAFKDPAVDPAAVFMDANPASDAAKPAKSKQRYCGWLDGAWVNRDGRLDPCCLIHDVVDMGHIQEGPLHKNPKFNQVKDTLFTGKVFSQCAGQRMCTYVQQQEHDGIPLRFITRDDLGDLLTDSRCTSQTDNADAPDSIMALPVLAGA